MQEHNSKTYCGLPKRIVQGLPQTMDSVQLNVDKMKNQSHTINFDC